MVSDPVLDKALSLTRRGKYGDAIKMLEAEVFRYQESFKYFYILGLSCLYAGDFGGAFTYFNRAKNIKFKEPGPLLGLAVLFLRRGETDRALDIYLEIFDADGNNPIVKRGLKVIRQYGGTEGLSAWLEGGKISTLYPPLPSTQGAWKRFLPAAAIVLGAIIIICAIVIGIAKRPRAERSGLAGTVLLQEERSQAVEIGGSYRYVLTTGEVLSYYNEARTLFNSYHDEGAKRNLNRILESNASSAVKNKARLLKSYTDAPGFDTLKDRFSYAEVSAEPWLYRDCYVVWRGSAANVDTGESSIDFDFLVGYDTRRVMEGAVAVRVDFPASINANLPLEVLGRVVPLPGEEQFMLEGIALHQGTQP
jgi:tetratricopeptide (TPR) repeat protein